MMDSYTPEELAALPQTTTVFDQPDLAFNEHEWVQSGYTLHDICNPGTSACQNVGIPIPSGKLLVKDEKGRYDLIDERRGR